jgi:drug/metabolite transporter (DMT)-like permease
MNDWKAVSLVFVGACSYGVLSTFVKLAYKDGFQVGGVTGSQMLFGVLMLLTLLFATKKWTKLNRKQWVTLMLVGGFVGLTGLFYYTSLQYIPASIAIVLLFQFTWIGICYEAIAKKQRPSVKVIISLILLSLGTLLAGNVLQTGAIELSVIGLIYGFLAAITYAGFIISSGRVAVEVNPWMRSFIMSLGSLLVIWIIFPPAFLMDGSLGEGLWLWGGLLAFFGIVLPNLLFTYGVPRIGTSLSTILGSAELPMAVFMSWIVLQERITSLQWVGVVIILTGICVAELRTGKGKMQEN